MEFLLLKWDRKSIPSGEKMIREMIFGGFSQKFGAVYGKETKNDTGFLQFVNFSVQFWQKQTCIPR